METEKIKNEGLEMSKNEPEVATGVVPEQEKYSKENEQNNVFKLIDIFESKGNWRCHMVGNSFVLYPFNKDVPNWFFRTMQYLILGFKWRRNKILKENNKTERSVI